MSYATEVAQRNANQNIQNAQTAQQNALNAQNAIASLAKIGADIADTYSTQKANEMYRSQQAFMNMNSQRLAYDDNGIPITDTNEARARYEQLNAEWYSSYTSENKVGFLAKSKFDQATKTSADETIAPIIKNNLIAIDTANKQIALQTVTNEIANMDIVSEGKTANDMALEYMGVEDPEAIYQKAKETGDTFMVELMDQFDSESMASIIACSDNEMSMELAKTLNLEVTAKMIASYYTLRQAGYSPKDAQLEVMNLKYTFAANEFNFEANNLMQAVVEGAEYNGRTWTLNEAKEEIKSWKASVEENGLAGYGALNPDLLAEFKSSVDSKVNYKEKEWSDNNLKLWNDLDFYSMENGVITENFSNRFTSEEQFNEYLASNGIDPEWAKTNISGYSTIINNIKNNASLASFYEAYDVLSQQVSFDDYQKQHPEATENDYNRYNNSLVENALSKIANDNVAKVTLERVFGTDLYSLQDNLDVELTYTDIGSAMYTVSSQASVTNTMDTKITLAENKNLSEAYIELGKIFASNETLDAEETRKLLMEKYHIREGSQQDIELTSAINDKAINLNEKTRSLELDNAFKSMVIEKSKDGGTASIDDFNAMIKKFNEEHPDRPVKPDSTEYNTMLNQVNSSIMSKGLSDREVAKGAMLSSWISDLQKKGVDFSSVTADDFEKDSKFGSQYSSLTDVEKLSIQAQIDSIAKTDYLQDRSSDISSLAKTYFAGKTNLTKKDGYDCIAMINKKYPDNPLSASEQLQILASVDSSIATQLASERNSMKSSLFTSFYSNLRANGKVPSTDDVDEFEKQFNSRYPLSPMTEWEKYELYAQVDNATYSEKADAKKKESLLAAKKSAMEATDYIGMLKAYTDNGFTEYDLWSNENTADEHFKYMLETNKAVQVMSDISELSGDELSEYIKANDKLTPLRMLISEDGKIDLTAYSSNEDEQKELVRSLIAGESRTKESTAANFIIDKAVIGNKEMVTNAMLFADPEYRDVVFEQSVQSSVLTISNLTHDLFPEGFSYDDETQVAKLFEELGFTQEDIDTYGDRILNEVYGGTIDVSSNETFISKVASAKIAREMEIAKSYYEDYSDFDYGDGTVKSAFEERNKYQKEVYDDAMARQMLSTTSDFYVGDSFNGKNYWLSKTVRQANEAEKEAVLYILTNCNTSDEINAYVSRLNSKDYTRDGWNTISSFAKLDVDAISKNLGIPITSFSDMMRERIDFITGGKTPTDDLYKEICANAKVEILNLYGSLVDENGLSVNTADISEKMNMILNSVISTYTWSGVNGENANILLDSGSFKINEKWDSCESGQEYFKHLKHAEVVGTDVCESFYGEYTPVAALRIGQLVTNDKGYKINGEIYGTPEQTMYQTVMHNDMEESDALLMCYAIAMSTEKVPFTLTLEQIKSDRGNCQDKFWESMGSLDEVTQANIKVTANTLMASVKMKNKISSELNLSYGEGFEMLPDGTFKNSLGDVMTPKKDGSYEITSSVLNQKVGQAFFMNDSSAYAILDAINPSMNHDEMFYSSIVKNPNATTFGGEPEYIVSTKLESSTDAEKQQFVTDIETANYAIAQYRAKGVTNLEYIIVEEKDGNLYLSTSKKEDATWTSQESAIKQFNEKYGTNLTSRYLSSKSGRKFGIQERFSFKGNITQ